MIHVLYHNHCADGFLARVIAQRKLGFAVKFHAVNYKEPVPQPVLDDLNAEVFILDFSYPPETLLLLARKAGKVVVLDHHASAQRDHHASAQRDLEPLISDFTEVPLKNGKIALVDKDDLAVVAQYTWHEAVHGGAMAYAGGGRANALNVYMHRLILEVEDGVTVDHINRNPLDNRRCNLRLATKSQNGGNMIRGSNFKGVSRRGKRWQAQITKDYKNTHLGYFDTPEEAAKAYDEAAINVFGEFARGNFIEHAEPPPPNLRLKFDMTKSGAMLAWEHFNPGQRAPMIVQYVQDRDLGRPWSDPENAMGASLNIHAGLFRAQPRTYDAWSRWLDTADLDPLIDAGAQITRADQRLIRAVADHPIWIKIEGHEVPAAQLSPEYISDACNAMLLKHPDAPFAASWFVNASNGLVTYSLRSRTGGYDVSALAKSLGGGGHPQAAGFSSDQPPVFV